MDRQFDFRALLLKIQDRLTNDDRRRLHFLVGDIIPRMQRDDVTLGGTLTVLESLFDRAIINEDYLDFLIRIFREIQYYDAVKRLQEFQLSKQPSKERQLTVSSLLEDNLDEDKHGTIPYDQLIEDESDPTRLLKQDMSKQNTTKLPLLPSETRDVTDKPLNTPTVKHKQKMFIKFRLIYCLYIIFCLETLSLIIFLSISVHKNLSRSTGYQQKAYILKYGRVPPNATAGKWFDHSEEFSLTCTDQLLRIDALMYRTDVYSIKFLYSRNKSIEHHLRNFTQTRQLTLSSVDFKNKSVEEITQCYKSNNGSTHLVGLLFAFIDKSSASLGSCHDQIYSDKFSNHRINYVLRKTTEYLTGLQFVGYKDCPLNKQVTFCQNQDSYALSTDAFYKD